MPDPPMTQHSETVFVYGTLRRGGSNHFRMDGAEFVAGGTVRGRLYRIGWYPGLVADETAEEVVGEIYQVSAGMLGGLDDYEGPEYHREILDVGAAAEGRPVLRAWVWLWNGEVDEIHRISGGDWLVQT